MNKIKISFSKENYQEDFYLPNIKKENVEFDINFISNTLFSSINEQKNVVISSGIEHIKFIFSYEYLKDKSIKIFGIYDE